MEDFVLVYFLWVCRVERWGECVGHQVISVEYLESFENEKTNKKTVTERFSHSLAIQAKSYVNKV